MFAISITVDRLYFAIFDQTWIKCINVFYKLDFYFVQGEVQSSAAQSWKSEIPPILHRQWLTYIIPKITKKLVSSWNNQVPALQTWFWTESSFKTFIMEKIPGYAKEFKHPYQKKRFNVSDSEIWRYFIMYEYGGIFSELDFELLKPIDGRILNHSCVIAQEPLVRAFLMNDQYDRAFLTNEIMFCRPHHPFFRQVSKGLFPWVYFLIIV